MAYVRKGGNGGKRPGAGRPKGSRDVLPRGAVTAVQALGLRVPEDAAPEARALADEALNAVADVMRGEWVVKGASAKLAAAALIREEICGPIPKKHELTGKDGAPLVVEVIRYADVAGSGAAPE